MADYSPDDTAPEDAPPERVRDIDTILEDLNTLAENVHLRRANEEAGVAPSKYGTPAPDRRFKSSQGWVDAAKISAGKGWETFKNELTSPETELPGGIQQGVDAINEDDPTVLGRLRRAAMVGLGGARAGLSLGRVAMSPVTGVARAGVEFLPRLVQRPDEPLPDDAETAMNIGEMALGGYLGTKGAGLVKRMIAKGTIPPPGPPAPPPDMPPGPSSPWPPPKQIPATTGGPYAGPAEPERVFEAGPPGSVSAKPRVVEKPSLTSKDISVEAKPPDESRFGVTPAEEGDVPRTVLKTRLGQRLVKAGGPVEPRAPGDVIGETQFTTEKGSEYTLHADGTTTRVKAPRLGDIESGLQPKSDQTWFLDPDDASKLALIQARGGPGKEIAAMPDGRIGIRYTSGKDLGKWEARTLVTPKSGPRAGLTPVEVWSDGTSHFGNKITNVTTEIGPSTASQREVVGNAGQVEGESALAALRRRAKEAIKPVKEPTAEEAAAVEGAPPPPPRGEQQKGESLANYLRRLRRERDAARVEAGSGGDPVPPTPAITIKDQFPNGKPPEMSLSDWAKLQREGEAAKVAHAAESLTPEEQQGLPAHMQAALGSGGENASLNPRWMPKRLQDLSEWFKSKMPISATHLAKNDPEFSQLVKRFNTATSDEHALAESWITDFNKLEKQVGGAKKMEEFVRAVDAKAVPPNQGHLATKFRELFDKAAHANSLDPSHPLYEQGYVPHIRNSIMLEKMRMIPVEDWVSTDVMRHFPSHFRPSYTMARKIQLPGTDFTSDTMRAHLRAAARGAVWGTPIHHGVLKDVEPLLLKLSTRPEWKQDVIGNYVNYAIGHPSFRSAAGVQKAASAVRSVEFMRTIVGNVTSPIYNTFQRVLPMAEVAASSSLKAARDEIRWLRGDPRIVQLVKDAKIPLESLGPGKFDTEAFLGGRVKRLMTKIQDVGGIPFGFAERQNRVFTFLAGHHEGLRKGATEAEAIQAGRDLIHKTQFTPGPTDRPVWMRREVPATLGQFKYFQTKMGEYIWNNFSDVWKRGATPLQRYEASKKFIKFWGMTYALGGPQVMPFLGDFLEKHDPIQWKGALPYLGAAATDQLGTGGILPKDLKSLAYFIPGPAISHARDLLTAIGFDPYNPSTPPTVAARARGATRSIFPGGVQLERLRHSGMTDNAGNEREPMTAGEAIPPTMFGIPTGGTGMNPRRPLVQQDSAWMTRRLGFQDPAQEKSYNDMSNLNDAAAITNRAKHDATQALVIGDVAGSRRILRDAEKQLGMPIGQLEVSPQSIKAAKEASKSTPLERRRKALGKSLRNYGLEDTAP